MAAQAKICGVAGATRSGLFIFNDEKLVLTSVRSTAGTWKSSNLACSLKGLKGPRVLRKIICKSSRPFICASQIEESPKDNEEGYQLNFVERLVKAWAILFPTRTTEPSNAEIAKERLRLVLYSDRGDVSPEIRRKLRENIIKAISTYVEIETEEEVRLSVSSDPDVGTVYSVIVPVRRVKPEFQSHWGDGEFRDRVYFGEEGYGTDGQQTIHGSAELRFDSGMFDEDEDSFEQ